METFGEKISAEACSGKEIAGGGGGGGGGGE